MKKVIVIGAGGHGKVIADIVKAAGDSFVGFLDDDPETNALGAVGDFEKYADCYFVVGIGNPSVREKLTKRLPVKWYTAIHPTAVISPSVVIGEGSVVMANAVINVDAAIGKHCIINTGAIVEHDNYIDDYVHISVGARIGGMVSVGKSTWVGIGSTVTNNLSICEGCMIGAGAVVVNNIELPGTYVGVPVKRMSP